MERSKDGALSAGQDANGNQVHRPYVKLVYAPRNGDDPERRPHNVLSEAKALRLLSHINIVDLIDYTYDNGAHRLTLSRMAFTLQDLLDDFPVGQEVGTIFLSIAYQCLKGLVYLHGKEIAHRDVNPRNIMFDWDGTLKYVDFGIAWGGTPDSTEKEGAMICSVGTGPYRAPELLFTDTRYDPKAIDLWALGTVLTEILIDPVWAEKNHRPRPLFNDIMGDIGLAASIFRLRGSPNKDNWPDYDTLPDAGKIEFDHFQAQPLESVLTRLPECNREQYVAVIDGLLQYPASRRTPSEIVLSNNPLFLQPIHVPRSYPTDGLKTIIRDDTLERTFNDLYKASQTKVDRCTSV